MPRSPPCWRRRSRWRRAGSYLRADGRRRSPVLGLERRRPTGGRHDDRPHHAGGRERAGERGGGHRRGLVSHLCSDGRRPRRRGRVLGPQQLRPTGGRHGTDRTTPVAVSGLASGVAAIAAGWYHTCAVMDAGHGGGVKCWGWNNTGQLGDGTTTDRTSPVAVSGLASGVVAMAAGWYHTCAMMDAATAAGSSAGAGTAPANWGRHDDRAHHASGRQRAGGGVRPSPRAGYTPVQ